MTSFERNPRRLQEMKGRPFADAIYRAQLHAVDIRRFDRVEDEVHLLDRQYGIDVEIELTTGQILTCQEKFLSHEFARFNSVTFEFMQDPRTGEQGDWFRLCADLYFVAYFTPDGAAFCKWALLDVPMMKLATERKKIFWVTKPNVRSGKASFKYTRVDELPGRVLIWQRGFIPMEVAR